MAVKSLMSLAEFEQLAGDDLQHELDEGELVTMPPAAEDHGGIEGDLYYALRGAAQRGRLGRVYMGDTGFLLNPGGTPPIVRSPDIAFVSAANYRKPPRGQFYQGAPDFAVEIHSPSDSTPQLLRKVRQYLKYGTKVVWVVYPASLEVHVLERETADRVFRPGDTLELPGLVPGFSITVTEVFEST